MIGQNSQDDISWMQRVEGVKSPAHYELEMYTDLIRVQLELLNGDIRLHRLSRQSRELTSEQQVERVKKAVADRLKDPFSVQFRNVEIHDYGEFRLVCGEFNGKNSYGGYVGFKNFVGADIRPLMASSESEDAIGVSYIALEYCRDGLTLGEEETGPFKPKGSGGYCKNAAGQYGYWSYCAGADENVPESFEEKF